MGTVVAMLQWARIILAIGCALYGVALGAPDGLDNNSTVAIDCDCLQQIQNDHLPAVLSANKELSTVVDELFVAANQAELSPVTDRHICLFCPRVRRVWGHVNHGWYYNHHRWHTCYYSRCYPYHYNSCCRYRRWKRQVEEPANSAPPCPLEDVRAQEQGVKDSVKVVREVMAGIQADPKEMTQDFLDDITQLYNDVNSSVKTLKSATNTINKECSSKQEETNDDVAFPDQGRSTHELTLN